ncbi:MAG: NAD(P)-dependent oxidoreductase [Lachnospiraceae bacterium]|nr:NAD(P)-dependent oxidoreductase [Lachnospiraceae bacterium]
MRIAVSGPTGAIGHALLEACIENDIEVLAICRRGSKRIATLPKSHLLRVLELDLHEYAEFDTAGIVDEIGMCDVFYHLAWSGTVGAKRNDMRLQHKNVGYALDAVDLAYRLGCKKFIGAGSQAEYGRTEEKLSSATPTFPENGYGIAKLCAGQMTRHACEKLGLQHMWTRILSVYGPYDSENSMITATLRKLMTNQVPEFTKGQQQWDYLYSLDAARALLLLGEKGKHGKIYPVGSGKSRALSEYISELCEMSGCGIAPKFGVIPYAENQVMYLCADIEELTGDTGFVPTISFEEGIRRTMEWMNEKSSADI